MPIISEISLLRRRQAIGDGLLQVLSDTYVLFLRTHGFHWGVKGPTCSTLGLLFEEQYSELATAMDAIAEQIRVFGFPAPGGHSFYARLSSINSLGVVPAEDEMIEQLIQGQKAVLNSSRALLTVLCSADDPVTFDLLTQRVQRHEGVTKALRALQ